MNLSWLTAIAGTIVANVPAFLPMLPAPVALSLQVGLNLLNTVIHLYAPSPSAVPAPATGNVTPIK